MKKVLFLLATLISLSIANPSYASTLKLQDEISAYKEANYPEAIIIGHQLLKESPYNPLYHYYIANSYSRLGETADAIKEYSLCQILSEDPQLKAYCEQALHFLSNSQTSSQPIIQNNSSPYPFNLSSNNDVVNNATKDARAKIMDIRENSRLAIKAVPQYYYDDINQPIRNPDYKAAIANIRDQEKVSINNINEAIYAIRQIPQSNNQILNNIIPTPFSMPNQYDYIPGYSQSSLPSKYKELFKYSPFPPPPFPASAKEGAEKVLRQKLD